MKITGIETHAVDVGGARSWLFVGVHTDSGVTGWGEASQSRNDEAVEHDINVLKDNYLGKSPLDLIESSQKILRWPYVGKSVYAAVSGLEQALWDLCGKKLGVPVYQLLGGAVRDRVRAYANIGYAVADESPEEYARVATAVIDSGFTAVKLYAFGPKPDNGDSPQELRNWITMGVERVKAVRNAVGPNVDLLVDLMHQIDDLKLATQLSGALAPFNLYWIEDPFSHDIPDLLASYRGNLGTRLAGGAPYLDIRAYRPLLAAHAFDVLMPDVKWLGGILATKKAAVLADVYGVMCSPHNASGPISCAASVHVSATISNFLILEYAWGAPDWRNQLSMGTETIQNGHFVLSKRPGLGIEIDQTVLTAHAKSRSGGAVNFVEGAGVASDRTN